MPVLGRAAKNYKVEQTEAVFNTNITSTSNGKIVYFDISNSEWNLAYGVNLQILSNSIMGIISNVTVDGDTIGGKGDGFVTTRGYVNKAGALVGEVYYMNSDSTMVSVAPVFDPTLIVGNCNLSGYVFVDVDPQSAYIAYLEELTAVTAVYNFGLDEDWAPNPETTLTNFGADDNWTEGVVEYNTNFGADANWGELAA